MHVLDLIGSQVAIEDRFPCIPRCIHNVAAVFVGGPMMYPEIVPELMGDRARHVLEFSGVAEGRERPEGTEKSEEVEGSLGGRWSLLAARP